MIKRVLWWRLKANERTLPLLLFSCPFGLVRVFFFLVYTLIVKNFVLIHTCKYQFFFIKDNFINRDKISSLSPIFFSVIGFVEKLII
jgi:ABC-type phosphate transport system permease subunit